MLEALLLSFWLLSGHPEVHGLRIVAASTKYEPAYDRVNVSVDVVGSEVGSSPTWRCDLGDGRRGPARCRGGGQETR